MGIFRNDPQPFIGGRQPLEGRKMNPSLMAATVDSPPLRKTALTMAVILAAWVPPDPAPFMGGRQPLQARTLPPQITAVPVNNPPFSGADEAENNLNTILASWRAPEWPYVFEGRQGRLQPYAPA